MDVFILWHVHELNPFKEDAKLIGVYSDEDEAQRAIQRLGGQPGFRDCPHGFEIIRYRLNRDHWTEG